MEEYDLVNEPSQTVPDETLSIKEILYRFTSGIVDYNDRHLPYDNDDINIDDDVNPMNDSELTLSDIHNKMNYHYSRYQEMIELEKQKVKENEAGDKVEETK